MSQTPYTHALPESPEIVRRLTEKLNTAFRGVIVKEVNERIVIGIEEVCLKTIPFKKKDPWRDATIKKLKWKLKNGYFREMANFAFENHHYPLN